MIQRSHRLLRLAAFCLFAAAPALYGQFQPPGSLGALAPANLAKPRPKPPFDLTGLWLHGGGPDNNFRFSPPPGFKLTPQAQVHYDAARKAQSEGKVYRDDIGQCWPSGLPIMMTRVWPIAMIQMPTAIFMIQELMNTMRFIYLDGRPHTDPDIAVPSFNGESIGHWATDPKSWEGEWKWTKRWQRVDDRDIAEVECLPELNQHMPTTKSDSHVR